MGRIFGNSTIFEYILTNIFICLNIFFVCPGGIYLDIYLWSIYTHYFFGIFICPISIIANIFEFSLFLKNGLKWLIKVQNGSICVLKNTHKIWEGEGDLQWFHISARLILAPRPPMHFLHKTFPGTIDKISHCAKFHTSSYLVSWLPKIKSFSFSYCESTYFR